MIGLKLALLLAISVYHDDDWELRPRDKGQPHSPIGIIYDPTTGHRNTAFLVDKCHVLTTQHTLSETGPVPSTLPVKFIVGTGQVRGFEKSVVGKVIRSGGYNKRSMESRVRDWVLVRLEECLGSEFGYLQLGPVSADRFLKNSYRLGSAGYPLVRRESGGIWVDPACGVKGIRAGMWLHDCANWSGMSGSPLYLERSNRGKPKLTVVAMDAGGWDRRTDKWAARGSNEAIPISAILPLISDLIRP